MRSNAHGDCWLWEMWKRDVKILTFPRRVFFSHSWNVCEKERTREQRTNSEHVWMNEFLCDVCRGIRRFFISRDGKLRFVRFSFFFASLNMQESWEKIFVPLFRHNTLTKLKIKFTIQNIRFSREKFSHVNEKLSLPALTFSRFYQAEHGSKRRKILFNTLKKYLLWVFCCTWN